jgi:hypothetical protein
MIVVACKPDGDLTYHHNLTPAEFFDKMYRRELPFIPDDLMVVIFS